MSSTQDKVEAEGPAASLSDALEAGFRRPPASARPRTWWHWLGGNVTAEGVRLDLEWMQRIGLAGVQNFDAAFEQWGGAFETPRLIERPLVYLSPEWRRMKRLSVALAREAGLEFAVASSAGWSQTGGPWVQPSQAMKKLVWSETQVQGGAPFLGRIDAPPSTVGMFQDVPLVELGAPRPEHLQAYYADVATVAFRVPARDTHIATLAPSVTSSGGPIDAPRLWDGKLAESIMLPFGADGYAWIQFAFSTPQRIQAVTAVIGRFLSVNPSLSMREPAWLEASADGQTFTKVVDLPVRGAPQQTISFAPVVAPIFRVVLARPELSTVEKLGVADAARTHVISQLVLHTGARVNRFEDKAGYSTRQIVTEDDTPDVDPDEAIRASDVVDLTQRLQPDGSLHWTPPPGRWIVLRFCCSLIGRPQHPSAGAARGLEVDKLNRKHVRAYIDHYLGEYENALGPELMGNGGLGYVVTDSYEAGAQNWTDELLSQLSARRGYAPVQWLPVIAGHIVESAGASDRFLWDLRKTLGALIAEGHYEEISAALHERGMGRYGESHEHSRAFVGDGIHVKKSADVPMGAMWAAGPPEIFGPVCDTDIRESASVAHLYGKSFVAAESFTAFTAPGAAYGFVPENLKPFADRALAMGLNRFVIHTSVHQPDSRPGPGLGLGPVGQWFTRKETWAELARGWLDYLARSCYLLQQGRFVADLAYLYGEDTNVTTLFMSSAAPVPNGYAYDFINADALMTELSVERGKLITRAGMAYRVLALDPSTHRLSLPVLRKIRDLVRGGAAVIGAKPSDTPSLADDRAEFSLIADELWGPGPADRVVGSGRVIGTGSIAAALEALRIEPDVTFKGIGGAALHFVHRALEPGDLYFISNGSSEAQSVEASFRVDGLQPELWDADRASITAVSYRLEGGRTIVPLQLDAHGAVFLVFRRPAAVASLTLGEVATEVVATLQGPWDVCFPPASGAPERACFQQLHCWTHSDEPGIRYFSGIATYRKAVQFDSGWRRDRARVLLDLGAVRNVAEVLVNSRSAGILWKPPFSVDVGDMLQAGENLIEIRVANLWPNRLIGDKQPGASRVAFASFDPFTAESPLLPSGLLGPVRLLRQSARAKP